jgi:hypothetical protein
MPFIGVLQPIQPARRAVGASGLRLMMAEGEMQSLERAAGFFLVRNTRKT